MSDLLLGASFPANTLGLDDLDELDAWIDGVAAAGYDYISFGDHVLGVDARGLSPGRLAQWERHYPGVQARTPYDHEVVFREPFVLLTYVATRCALSLTTGLLVLPQRQTALVAKQAAEVDLISGERLRLGVGVGWNTVEYSGLGASFRDRQDMLEEQMVLLRRFWTEPVVDFSGRFHTIESSGIQALPRRAIPLWIGGDGPRSLDRIGRLADGWQPPGRVQPGVDATEKLEVIHRAAECAGRDPGSIGVEARLFMKGGRTPGEIREFADSWRRHGTTHMCIETRDAPGGTVAAHLDQLGSVTRDLL